MTYVVTENCIKCVHQDCVTVCPVDCFYIGPNFMTIDPDECIDCAVCVPECPVDAIVADTDIEGTACEKWTHLNAELAKLPSFVNIVEVDESKRDPDRDKWDGVPNKIDLLDRGET
jgi:ferredoxin